MNLWAAQFALPVYAWVPLGLAALVPLLLLALIPLSRRRGRGIATALTLRTMVVLAVGFGLLATVATVAVVQTGLRELRQRHTTDARALADELEHGPLGLATGDAQLRLTLFRAKEPDIAFVVAGTDGCASVCAMNFTQKRFNPRLLKAALISAWPMNSTDQFTISVESRPYLLISSPVRDVAGKPRAAFIVGVDAQYLADQAARTTWLLLGISYSLLFVVGWTTWRQVSRSLTTRIRAINAQLQEGVVDDAPHEVLEVDGHELRQLADSVSTYIKRSLDERSSSDERHRRLAELSPDAVLMCADRRIRSANPAAIALAGARNRSDLVASMIDKFIEFDTVKATTENGSNPLRPATWRRLDGGLLHVEVAEITDSTRGEVIRQFVVRDITSRKRREADLAHRAEHDSLTNLVNRSRFESRLNELIDPAAALASKLGYDREVAVLFIDLDGFKPVNDTYGHAAGDAVLVAVAGRLRDSTRGSDLIARLGGDEFAVLLEVRDTAEVSAVSRRIIRALRQPIPHEANLLAIGASIGIASTRPGGGAPGSETAMSAAELVKAADEAMYAAKSSGGDRIVLFGSVGQSTEQLTDVSFPKVA